jgi:hypothetical protein
MTTERCFVGLTQYDLVQPLQQTFIYGQTFSAVFLVYTPPPSITFEHIYKALDNVKIP